MNLLFIGKELYLYITNDAYHNSIVLFGIIILSFCILLGIVGLFFILRKSSMPSKICKVISKENKTGNYYFGYFSLFVLLFMSFDFGNLMNLIIFFVLTAFLAVVYCRNDLFYINPTILLFGKRIYELRINDGIKTFNATVITKENIIVNNEYEFFFSPYEFTTCIKNKV